MDQQKQSLEELVDRYLVEQRALGRMSAKRAFNYRYALVGKADRPFCIRSGLVSFLKQYECERPEIRHLNWFNVSAFQEYLVQKAGIESVKWVTPAISKFWAWAHKNGIITDRNPPDEISLEEGTAGRRFKWLLFCYETLNKRG